MEIGFGTTDEELEESDVGSGPEEQEESDYGSGTENYATEFTPHMVCRCPDVGEPILDYLFSQQRFPGFNHLYPFHTARDYKLARFLVLSKVPKTQINDFFRDDILSSAIVHGKKDISFQSGHTLYKQTSRMTQDPEWDSGQVEFCLYPKSEFRFRSILRCIQYLLRQRAFVNNMLWAPIKVFNNKGERVYSGMNTASWWWEEQVFNQLVYLNIIFVH